MDSRLLNVFHDDPFDGNYVKYDTDTQFWSSGSETLGLQLAETLHGILPIAPTEMVSTNIYNNSLLKNDDYSLENKHGSNSNSIIYGDYEDGPPLKMVGKSKLSNQQAIEIVSVDPNEDYDSEFSESTMEEDEDHRQMNGVVAFDEIRSCSRSTFRSRTDSSSIGDYESHSSDYDDDSEGEDEMEYNYIHKDDFYQLPVNGINELEFHSNSKKTLDDEDALGIQLDANTFDLAAFITQDDQLFENNTSSITKIKPLVDLGEIIMPTKSFDSDSDSDVIVDVETVETDDIVDGTLSADKENDMAYKDNVKGDPSWSPKSKNEKKETKPVEPNFARNFTVLPNKRQSDILKRKFGLGRGKNLSMHRNTSKGNPKAGSKGKTQPNNNNNCSNNNNNSNNSIIQIRISAADKKIETLITKEKAPLAISAPAISAPAIVAPAITAPGAVPPPAQKNKTNKEMGKKLLKHDTVSIQAESKTLPHPEPFGKAIEVIETLQKEKFPLKRKLNIEEYKKRRENSSVFHTSNGKTNQTVDKNKMLKTESSIQTTIAMNAAKSLQQKCQTLNKPAPNTAVSSIVKSLKENQGSKRFVDPITEAKNKVLRLQELKKAQQIKIIDSTVSSKVGRVTKILPLKDIVKDSYRMRDDSDCAHATGNPDYEEIIIVSTGCNTDITIPPAGYSAIQQKSGQNMSRSLLKSSILFANISNTFQKVRSDDTVKLSSNSLIASIQDVVVKKSAPIPTEPIEGPQKSAGVSEHGEDKVIMHLRKDRIRKRKFSQSTQTDLLPEFPTLPPPVVESMNSCDSFQSRSRKGRSRKYRSRQNSYSSDEECRGYRDRSRSSSGKRSRRHRSSISSSYSESDDYAKRGRWKRTTSSHSRERSLSSNGRRSRSRSRSRSGSFDRVYRNSRSRSKSSSRSRSISRRYVDKNVSAPAVEERRIVYVGRIEQDTTKEMLRKKFMTYGPIKQITIHYKDTGMKYGFVTYEKSEDAFKVIDSGPKDATISMYDISFGGRRAFCRASYADLDNAGINTYQSYVVPRPVAPPKEEDSFEALLLKVKAKLSATKSATSNSKI